jgi:hypothetical protein
MSLFQANFRYTINIIRTSSKKKTPSLLSWLQVFRGGFNFVLKKSIIELMANHHMDCTFTNIYIAWNLGSIDQLKYQLISFSSELVTNFLNECNSYFLLDIQRRESASTY